MFRPYLDESKSPEGIFVVAGFVLHAQGWTEFEDKWAKALERWKVSEFHANRFERRVDEYANWREPYRRQFYNHLVCTLADTRAASGSCGAPEGVFRTQQHRSGCPRQHRRALRFRCFELVPDWFERNHRPEPVAYVLDEGGGYQGELAAAYEAAIRRGDNRSVAPSLAQVW